MLLLIMASLNIFDEVMWNFGRFGYLWNAIVVRLGQKSS